MNVMSYYGIVEISIVGGFTSVTLGTNDGSVYSVEVKRGSTTYSGIKPPLIRAFLINSIIKASAWRTHVQTVPILYEL